MSLIAAAGCGWGLMIGLFGAGSNGMFTALKRLPAPATIKKNKTSGTKLRSGSVADRTRLKIYIPMTVNGEEKYAIPDPPLNFNIKVGGIPISFKRQTDKLATLAKLKNVRQIEKYISEKANERNKLLYAAAHGYPHVESVKDDFFFHQKQKVIKMGFAYLLIEPYKEKQPFVQQAIDSLLKMLGKIESPNLNDQN